jgi:hypothetical protein
LELVVKANASEEMVRAVVAAYNPTVSPLTTSHATPEVVQQPREAEAMGREEGMATQDNSPLEPAHISGEEVPTTVEVPEKKSGFGKPAWLPDLW